MGEDRYKFIHFKKNLQLQKPDVDRQNIRIKLTSNPLTYNKLSMNDFTIFETEGIKQVFFLPLSLETKSSLLLPCDLQAIEKVYYGQSKKLVHRTDRGWCRGKYDRGPTSS